nr:cupredoxin domain-containing protein [uncultured Nitrososphaera sp.]
MNATKKTKTVVPIVIAVAVLGAAIAVLSSAAGTHQNNASATAASSATGGSPSSYTTTSAAATTSPIKMSAKEVDETYRWLTSDGGNNPTLKMTANADNTVQIANPTDAKHELVIESNGKELASSGDIAPNGSGQLSFKPATAGTFEYHCEYHPDTMKGTIEVASAGTS